MFLIASGVFVMSALTTQALPAWEPLDQRDTPQWFEDAKFGIFIHWGVYSVPAWGPVDRYAEWYWHDMQDKAGETWKFHERTYGADFKYTDFASRFTAEMFDPGQWAELFRRSGAKYVVLTSKHHEGFCLWPSTQSWNWNSVDVGPGRDLCGELGEAVRGAGLRYGFYYSLYEWFNPLYLHDVDRYVEQHMLPQFKDLVERYKPDIVWPDGEWAYPSSVWRSTEFLSWLFNESSAPKDVVVNDRWGKETRNVHGGFATPEYGHIPEGRLVQAGLFEECQGIGKSFGYNRNENIDNYRTPTELIHLLIDVVSRGGNLLLDVGPTADGRIPVIMQQRLVAIGEWLTLNGEAIYGTAGVETPDEDARYRFTRGDHLYVHVLDWPGPTFRFRMPDEGCDSGAVSRISLVGEGNELPFTQDGATVSVEMPRIEPGAHPGHAWVFQVECATAP